MLIDVFEWSGSVLGLLGAFLLATHNVQMLASYANNTCNINALDQFDTRSN